MNNNKTKANLRQKTNKQEQKQNKNKTPKELFIVVIHHYLLYK